MGVWTAGVLGLLAEVNFFQAEDLSIGPFKTVIILDFAMDGRDRGCCLAIGEQVAEVEEPVFFPAD